MMGCGIDHFGRRGLETTNSDKIWSKILFPGVWTRGATRGFDSRLHWNWKLLNIHSGYLSFCGLKETLQKCCWFNFYEITMHQIPSSRILVLKNLGSLAKNFWFQCQERYLGFHKIETVWVGGLKDFECETLGWEWSVWLTAGFTSNLRDFLRICLGTSQWQMVSDRSCLCIGLQPQKISSFLAQT